MKTRDLEKKLVGLFDFQRFEKNERLDTLIEETQARYASTEFTDDELAWVNAAGDVQPKTVKIVPDKADDEHD